MPLRAAGISESSLKTSRSELDSIQTLSPFGRTNGLSEYVPALTHERNGSPARPPLLFGIHGFSIVNSVSATSPSASRTSSLPRQQAAFMSSRVRRSAIMVQLRGVGAQTSVFPFPSRTRRVVRLSVGAQEFLFLRVN